MGTKVLPSLVILIPLLFVQSYLPSQVQSQEKPLIKAGDYFPEIPLQTPSNPAEGAYLGLPEDKTFTLKDIKAEVVSRPSGCDVCHDLHFIYVFNEAGKVLKFVPLQVAKYENEEFDEDDLRKMKNSKEKASSRPFQSLP